MAGWYHEKAWKQLVSTAISHSSAFTPEEQFSKAGICAPWRLWLGGYSYQHWTFSSGLMRQAGPVEAPTVNRTNAILSSNGLQVLHELWWLKESLLMRGCAAFRLQREQSLYSIVAISLRKKTHRYTELFSTKVEMRLPPCIALGSLYSRSSLRFSSLCPFTQEDSDDNLWK